MGDDKPTVDESAASDSVTVTLRGEDGEIKQEVEGK